MAITTLTLPRNYQVITVFYETYEERETYDYPGYYEIKIHKVIDDETNQDIIDDLLDEDFQAIEDYIDMNC